MKPLFFVLFAIVLTGFFFGCAAENPVSPAEDLASLEKGGRPFFIELSGANESPGDPLGSGTAKIWLNQGQGTVTYEVQVENLSAPITASHIHRAPVGVAGPPVVFIGAFDATGFSGGVVTGVDPELIKDIRQNPSQYYLNVHTTQFPAGAVRGQLEK